ncbi:MAG: nucleotidyltransferase domain-containing protein [Rickettsiales bacterium]|nr:nucleotidyltransferase domain-containing protein [Rickettsiales bacterium]
MNLEEVKNYRDSLINIALSNNADRIRVFGSVARNEANAGSDLDLLVKFNKKASYFDMVRLNRSLEELLKCKVDVVSEDAIKDSYANYILLDARDI